MGIDAFRYVDRCISLSGSRRTGLRLSRTDGGASAQEACRRASCVDYPGPSAAANGCCAPTSSSR